MPTRSGDIDRTAFPDPLEAMKLEIGKALNGCCGWQGEARDNANDIKRLQPLNHGVRIGKVVLNYGDVGSIAEAPTNRPSQGPQFGNRPEYRSCTSSLAIPR